jgi:hypothetical protein
MRLSGLPFSVHDHKISTSGDTTGGPHFIAMQCDAINRPLKNYQQA